MSDITKCIDSYCPSKEKCYRYTAPSTEYQSYDFFNRETDAYNCDMFRDNKICKYCGLQNGNHKLECPNIKITIIL